MSGVVGVTVWSKQSGWRYVDAFKLHYADGKETDPGFSGGIIVDKYGEVSYCRTWWVPVGAQITKMYVVIEPRWIVGWQFECDTGEQSPWFGETLEGRRAVGARGEQYEIEAPDDRQSLVGMSGTRGDVVGSFRCLWGDASMLKEEPRFAFQEMWSSSGGMIGEKVLRSKVGMTTMSKKSYSSRVASSISTSMKVGLGFFSASVDASVSSAVTTSSESMHSSSEEMEDSITIDLSKPCYVYRISAEVSTVVGDFTFFGRQFISNQKLDQRGKPLPQP